jgi:N6-L-threonylcarbamoyladenine synthase
MTAKTLAQVHGIPLIGVNHLEGHILAPFLSDKEHSPIETFAPPYIALAISGGHTSLYEVRELGDYHILGQTLDDAAGEAFDKFAKLVGLGYPGGVAVDRHGARGRIHAFPFPRSMMEEGNFNFSFSGLKSSAQRLVAGWSREEIVTHLNDLCASYQEAIVDVLVNKLQRATATTGIRKVLVTGGVSANSRLRQRVGEWTQRAGFPLLMPPLRYCTDNAAMIGLAGVWRLARGEFSDLSLGPSPQSLDGDFR